MTAARFRTWRRSRPFWGGVLLLLAGLEMLLIPLTGVLARGQIKLVIYVGIGGVFGIGIGALLIACGLALWFTPMQKTFYAIAGVLLSLLSFIGTNLGGFFIGMLLGIVGGSLAFAWYPAERPEERPEAERPEPERTGPYLAVAVLLAVAAGMLTGGGHASAAEDVAQSGPGCVLFIICTSPSPSPVPSASPSPPTSGGGPGGVLPAGGVLPSAGLGRTVPGGTGSSSNSMTNNSMTSTGTQGLVVSSSPSVITASSATLDGLAYQGAVAMPVSGGGTVTMMKFTMSAQQLSGLDLTVTGTGGTLTTAAVSASFSGRVVLYATKLSGKLAGVPLTLVPDNAESTLLKLLNSLTPLVPVTLTGVTADEPVVLGNSGTITGLAVGAS